MLERSLMLISSWVEVERTVTGCRGKLKATVVEEKAFELERTGKLPNIETRLENLTPRGIILSNFWGVWKRCKKRHDVHSSFFYSRLFLVQVKKYRGIALARFVNILFVWFSVMFIFSILWTRNKKTISVIRGDKGVKLAVVNSVLASQACMARLVKFHWRQFIGDGRGGPTAWWA